MPINAARCGGSAASCGFLSGRPGSPQGSCLLRATPRWSLLRGHFWRTCPGASCHQRLEPRSPAGFARGNPSSGLFLGSPQLWVIFPTRYATPPPHFRLLQTEPDAYPAPNFWRCSDWRERLLQLNWRLRYQSCIKVATVEFPGLGNLCRLRNRPRLFNDIRFHRDLQAGGGVFTTGAGSSVCWHQQPGRSPRTGPRPWMQTPPPLFSPLALFLPDRKVPGLIVSSICGEDGGERKL